MKKSTSLKRLSLKTETIGLVTDLAGVHGGLPSTSSFLTAGGGPVVSKAITCAGCPGPTTFATTR